ncbi:MAG: HD domain-containing protein [Thermoguttaceae bacterium]
MNVKLVDAMTRYFSGDPKRISHFMKVCAYAVYIGESEGLDPTTLHILEAAALVHDIGVKKSEEIHGRGVCDGKKQEKYGPPLAEAMLRELGEDEATIQRVSYLVSRHHTYNDVDGIDYRILLEADFIVNAYEDERPVDFIRTGRDIVFQTKTGIAIVNEIFNL